MLDEGARTLGVWLPLALADILFAIARPNMDKEQAEKLTRANILASWLLPALSAAVKNGEEEAKALEMYAAVERMKSKAS